MAEQRAIWPWRLLPVLLLGAGLRLYGLNNVSPPGLEHDEVANWLIDRAILGGRHAIYFSEAYGHEAGFHYVQAAFVALIGDNALALRLPAAFMGLLVVAVAFALARQMFGPRVAFVSAALLAVLFFPVFYSRLALRAIMLPLLSGLSATFWWQGWQLEQQAAPHGQGSVVQRLLRGAPHRPRLAPDTGRESRYLLLAGIFAGLSVHTYMAARVVPIFYALFTVALLLVKPAMVRARRRQLILFWAAFMAIAAPLFVYLLLNPGAEFRISEIDAPLRALRQGDLRPVVDNFVDIVAGFGFRGDPLWRQNVAYLPLFDPLLALLFYACSGLALLYSRDVRYLFVILWALTATIPSMVTIDAPSNIRMINILPVLTLLPAILMHNLARLSTEKDQLSTATVEKWIAPLLILGLVLLHSARTVQALFVTWPANEEVRFVWQEALTDAAGFVDGVSHIQDVALGGWTPDTMDAPTMALTLRREDLLLRHFDPRQSVILPAATAGAPAYILRPAILPFDGALQQPLQAAGAISETHGSFVAYRLLQPAQATPAVGAGAPFGDELTFLGYTPAAACFGGGQEPDCSIVTYWLVRQRPAGERHIFMHVLDQAGGVAAYADALGAPSGYWQAGDLILQKHLVPADLLAGGAAVNLGVYDPASGRRLPSAGGQEFVTIQPRARP